ncbi:MAG: response regulator transcription factor [Chloroflexota bacterium]
MHVLVVEADQRRGTRLSTALASHGCVLDVATSKEDGRWLAEEGGFDAVIIDWCLPDGDGVALCAELRAAGLWVPIIIVGDQVAPEQRAAALDAGADDCVTGRPTGEELCAHLRAVVRRGQPERPVVLSAGSVRLDPASRLATAGGATLALSGRALAILELLMRRAGQVVTRTEIGECAWDWAWEAHSNVIAVHIHEIRSALREIPGAPEVRTVRAGGFQLVDPAATAPEAADPADPADAETAGLPDAHAPERVGFTVI